MSVCSGCTPRFVFKKLFTKEDPVYLHKVLGLLSLCSFIYRYAIVYPREGNLGFKGSVFDWATMGLHLMLSCSSLIFHVLLKRIPSKPMVIWHEYRLHAMVFTLRCCTVYAAALLRPFSPGSIADRLVLLPTVLIPHLLADEITRRYGPEDPGQTTIRCDEKKAKSLPIVIMSRFYSFYQFAALGSHLLPNAHLADLGFNTLIAIQSSAFLMTLFRKGLINWYSHGLWYTGALVLSLFHIFRCCPGFVFPAKLFTAFMLRTQLRVNKYFIWSMFVIMSFPSVELAFNERYAMYAEPIAQEVTKNWLQLSATAFVGIMGTLENMPNPMAHMSLPNLAQAY